MKKIIGLGFLLTSLIAFANLKDDEKSKAKKEQWTKGEVKQQRMEDESHKRKQEGQQQKSKGAQ